MSMTAVDIASLEVEGIQELIPELLKSEKTLDSLFEDNGRAQRVGTIAYRIPMKYARPGDYKSGSLDGAALPIGGGSKWDKGTITPQTLMLPVGSTENDVKDKLALGGPTPSVLTPPSTPPGVPKG